MAGRCYPDEVVTADPSLESSGVAGGNKALRGPVLWSAASTLIQATSKLLVFVLLARVLTPADFGLYAGALIIFNISNSFSQLGVGPALVQARTISNEIQASATGFSLLLGGTLAAMVIVWASELELMLGLAGIEPLLVVLAPTFVLGGWATVREAALFRQLRFRTIAIGDFAAHMIGFAGVSVIAGFALHNVWALVLGHLARVVVRLAFLGLVVRDVPAMSFRVGPLRSLLSYGAGLSVGRLLNEVALYVDYVVVGRYLGATALGLYERAYSLMTAQVVLFGQTLDRALFPVLAGMRRSALSADAAVRASISMLSAILVPLSVWSIFVAPSLVALLLGDRWTGLVVALQVLLLGLYPRTAYKIFDSVLKASGSVWSRAGLQGLYAALVFGGAMAGRRWGIAGVSAGVFVATTVHAMLMGRLAARELGLRGRAVLGWHREGLLGGGALAILCTGLLQVPALETLPAIPRVVAFSLPLVVTLPLVYRSMRKRVREAQA